jgi:hypothetical protein
MVGMLFANIFNTEVIDNQRNKQHSPYQPQPQKFGAAAQDPINDDTSPKLDAKRVTRIQQIVGSILYYARAIDHTTLPGLSGIASEQADARKSTKEQAEQLLDYLHTHPDAVIRYHASDMILNIHSDASYLSEPRARTRRAGYYVLGSKPMYGQPIKLH